MSIKTFISYSHDSAEHKESVLNLAQRMREDGIKTMIDAFVPFPKQGWQHWMREQIETSDYVIMVFTPEYSKRFLGKSEKMGKGVTFEGSVITQLLYDSFGNNEKFIPAVLDIANIEKIPVELRKYTPYTLMDEYIDLLRLITNQQEIIPAKVGKIKNLRNHSNTLEKIYAIINEATKEKLQANRAKTLLSSLEKLNKQTKEKHQSLISFVTVFIILECHPNHANYDRQAERAISMIKNLKKEEKEIIKKIKFRNPILKSLVREKTLS